MSTEWVDFKKVKAAVDMQSVLDHYDIKGLTKSGDELRGPCPIHKGSQRSKNFTVNVHKSAFKCFCGGRGAGGNVLDFVAAMEHCEVKDAAIKLWDWFKVGESQSPHRKPSEEVEIEVRRGIYSDENGLLFEVIATARSAEDFAAVVVYRELSGDYQFWVAPPSTFTGDCDTAEPLPALFTLVKAL